MIELLDGIPMLDEGVKTALAVPLMSLFSSCVLGLNGSGCRRPLDVLGEGITAIFL